ncbi:MAG: hypothetical protein HRF49_04605 [bacterium]|jgi:hypothetical protein
MRSLAISIVIVAALCASAHAATVSVDKEIYKLGEKIRVTFTDPGANAGAWIGLFDASVPTDPYTDADDYDRDYAYTGGKTSGVVELDAVDTGFFQVRFFERDADPDIPVASSATFQISTEGGRIGDPTVAFDKPVYKRGEKVKLTFTFNPSLPDGAWIGLFKNFSPLDGSEDPDDHDIKYEYVSGRTSGVWAFDAPDEPGYYVAAIISGDSNEWTPYCRVRMQVTLDGKTALPVADDRNPLAASAVRVRAGDEITIAYKTPLGVKSSAWLGLIPASVGSLREQDNDAADIDYIYVKAGQSWYWTFHSPSQPGTYVVRLFPADENDAYAINQGVYFEVVPR